MSRVPFDHLILTRFNVNAEFDGALGTDPDWLAHRLALFDAFCYPSVRGQACLEFRWLVFFDAATPAPVRREMAARAAAWPAFVPCYVQALEPGVYRQAVAEHLAPHSTALLTTRLDNDDALAIDFVARLQQYARTPAQPAVPARQVINFPNGLVFSRGKAYRARRPSNPFVSLLEGREGFRTVWCAEHTRLAEVGPVAEVEAPPLWLQVVHERNLYNRVVDCVRVPVGEVQARFRLDYPLAPEAEHAAGVRAEAAWGWLQLKARAGLRRVKRVLEGR